MTNKLKSSQLKYLCVNDKLKSSQLTYLLISRTLTLFEKLHKIPVLAAYFSNLFRIVITNKD